MIRRGLTLRSKEGGHIFVVLNNPALCDGDVLLVNFTSFREGIHGDEYEIFNSADYNRLPHDSVVYFEKAKSGPVAEMQPFIDSFTPMPDIPESTLERIIQAGKNSRQLSRARKLLLNRFYKCCLKDDPKKLGFTVDCDPTAAIDAARKIPRLEQAELVAYEISKQDFEDFQKNSPSPA